MRKNSVKRVFEQYVFRHIGKKNLEIRLLANTGQTKTCAEISLVFSCNFPRPLHLSPVSLQKQNFENMEFAEAAAEHIPAMHRVRMSVRENVLSNPNLVTEKDYLEMLENNGKGWVCFEGGELVGFAIVDLKKRNIWALFVSPNSENQGIGKKLQKHMLDWTFAQPDVENLWLSTAPGTRAEQFYQKTGWQKTGFTASGELRFEMSRDFWLRNL